MIKQAINVLCDLCQGAASVSAVYQGTAQVYPGVVRTDSGTDYGVWSYSGSTRSRTATPWSQDIYQNGTLGPKMYGATTTQTENATITTYWDGSTYWNAACSGYDSIDYQQVRPQYNWSDGQVTYGDWTNGAQRNKGRVEDSCGWVRGWSDWSRTGATCNSGGTAGSYDCSGDYTVRYHQEVRYLQFPDGSGRADTQYRANGEASRRQEDGVCGYTPIPPNTLTISVTGNASYPIQIVYEPQWGDSKFFTASGPGFVGTVDVSLNEFVLGIPGGHPNFQTWATSANIDKYDVSGTLARFKFNREGDGGVTAVFGN